MNKYENITSFKDFEQQEKLLLKEIEYTSLKLKLSQQKLLEQFSPSAIANDIITIAVSKANTWVNHLVKSFFQSSSH